MRGEEFEECSQNWGTLQNCFGTITRLSVECLVAGSETEHAQVSSRFVLECAIVNNISTVPAIAIEIRNDCSMSKNRDASQVFRRVDS
jgi:hypothetical protein